MTTKTCNFCQEVKPLDNFPAKGLKCKTCCNLWLIEHRRKQREAYLALHPPQPKPVISHKICKKCEEDKVIDEFRWANKSKTTRSPYCKVCAMHIWHECRARRGRLDEVLLYKCNRIGTTPEWFNAQMEKQNGNCAICGNPETHRHHRSSEKIRSLAIDHNHETGKVRGLLCFRCNTALHQLEKNGLGWAEAAVQYLKET